MFESVLILCEANRCRSPMAEILFKQRCLNAAKKFSSAGIAAAPGYPVPEDIQNFMQEQGYDLSNHAATPLTEGLLVAADLILVMSQEQKKHLENRWPMTVGRVYRLANWLACDILDPYRRPKLILQQVYGIIDQSVNDWLQIIGK